MKKEVKKLLEELLYAKDGTGKYCFDRRSNQEGFLDDLSEQVAAIAIGKVREIAKNDTLQVIHSYNKGAREGMNNGLGIAKRALSTALTQVGLREGLANRLAKQLDINFTKIRNKSLKGGRNNG